MRTCVEEIIGQEMRASLNDIPDNNLEVLPQNPVGKKVIEPEDTGRPAPDSSGWDNIDPYSVLKKGMKLTYTFYNAKGKVDGYNIQEIMEISHSPNSVKAVVRSTFADRKAKSQSSNTIELVFKNGNFKIDALGLIRLRELENMTLKMEVTGREMELPSKLTQGLVLPDGFVSLQTKMEAGENFALLPKLEFRIFNRRAVRPEIVNTPMGEQVCYKIIQTMEIDYPIVGKKYFTSITWIGKGIGMVKTEGYDAKGRKVNSMLLTNIE